jgi:hypothetical protein
MAFEFANAVKGHRSRALLTAYRPTEKLTPHMIGKTMNTRIVSTLVLTFASVTGVQAQAELPNQWLDQQMKAAKQDQGARGRTAAIASNAAAAKTTATSEVAHQVPAVLPQQMPRSVANVANNSPATQK